MREQSDNQQAPASAPRRESTLCRNKEILSKMRCFAGLPSAELETPPFKGSARTLVRHFLSSLAPKSKNEENLPLRKALAVVSKATASIAEAAEQDIITTEEADALVNFIVGKFVERRFDEVFEHIVTPQSGGWFLMGRHLLSHNW